MLPSSHPVRALLARTVLGLTILFGLPIAQPAAQSRLASGKATLAQLEAVLDKPEAERIAVVKGVTRDDSEAVTTILVAEIGRAQDTAYRAALLDALGALPRPGAVDVLTRLTEATDTAPAERMRAARGLAKQGEDAVRRLGAIASASDDAVPMARTYAMMALSQTNSDLGWQLLAEAVRDGDGTARSQGIRYLQRAPTSELVTAARLAAAGDAQVMTAASAVRQLAEQGHPRAAELVRELCARSTPPTGYTAVDALYAVCAVLEPSLHDAALTLAGEARRAGSSGTRALDELLPKLVGDKAFVSYVRTRLGKVEDPGQVRAAMELLEKVPGEDVSAEIVAFAGSRDPEVVSTALRVLAARKDVSVLPELGKLLGSKEEARRLETLQCVHALRSGDVGWEAELLERLRKTSRSRRDVAEFGLTMTLLSELGCEEALATAWDALDHKDWTVRAAAIDFCARVRKVESVPKLIDRLDEESGRLREDLLDVLRSLTAMRFNEQRRWQEWWKDSRDGFALIPADAFAKEDAAAQRPKGATAASYYGIPLVSDRVVFVVDVSGSMSAKVGTGGTRTRLDEAKAQLRRVVENTPKHFLFNVVSFHTDVAAIFDAMQKVGGRGRDEALQRIDDLKPLGATNVHDALRRAFDEREVDTIYLLSDGSPSAGPITDPEQLADAVQAWNRTRRLRIHCIAIGADSPMLKRIAAESGGNYAMTR